MSSAEALSDALLRLGELHHEIDRDARILEAKHSSRLQCRRGCSACCLDDLRVTRIEAEHIRRNHSELLARETPHGVGACAFLDAEGACRIYANRPTICRSQGLPLRVLFENEELEIEERRDICALNIEGGPALESLDEEDCWLVGPHELRVQQLDAAAFDDEPTNPPDIDIDTDTDPDSGADQHGRIALRALFEVGRSED